MISGSLIPRNNYANFVYFTVRWVNTDSGVSVSNHDKDIPLASLTVLLAQISTTSNLTWPANPAHALTIESKPLTIA